VDGIFFVVEDLRCLGYFDCFSNFDHVDFYIGLIYN